MHQQNSQVNWLLFLVSILALVGGLAIVIVTSPQSWQYGPGAWLAAALAKPTRIIPTAPPTASPTLAPTAAVATPTAQATGSTTIATPVIIATTPPSDTPTPEATVTATLGALPPDVTALAVVTTQGAGSARVRDQPGGENLVAAVPSGTQVQVLGGKVEFNNIVWLQIRLPGGQVGWIANFLLQITRTFS